MLGPITRKTPLIDKISKNIEENIEEAKKRDPNTSKNSLSFNNAKEKELFWYQDHTIEPSPEVIEMCKTDLSREELIDSPLASSIAGIAEGVFGTMYAKIKKELREEMMPKGIEKLKMDVDNFKLLEDK